RDRTVLEQGVLDLPLIWETDAFALAAGYEDGRYVGLWIPGDANSPPAATDSLLIVRPDVAVQQRQQESSETPPSAPGSADDPASPRTKGMHPGDPNKTDVGFPPAKTRFYGVK